MAVDQNPAKSACMSGPSCPQNIATWLQVKPPQVDFGNSSNYGLRQRANCGMALYIQYIYIYIVYLQIAHRVLYPHAALQHLCTPIHVVVYIDIILYKTKLCVYIYIYCHTYNYTIWYTLRVTVYPFFWWCFTPWFPAKCGKSTQPAGLLPIAECHRSGNGYVAVVHVPWHDGKTCWQRYNIG